MHKIKDVESGSIANQLEIEPGDMLLTINGQKIIDVLDYRFMIQEEELLLEIEKPNGEIWELDIEKEEADDIGLIFESGLMDQAKSCHNRCIFCFVDQLPKKMRKSLYFKDDDFRLSFLMGNYVTLTNIDQAEAERIIHYHLSPMHISVHAADLALRRKMLNNSNPDDLFEYLKKFNDAGITMHFQIVLCKGINDGGALDKTISALLNIGSKASSLSVVPVGLTKYREGLHVLEPFLQEDAKKVINQVEKWQAHIQKERGTSFVFCADEWYIKANLPMPPYKYYEDFPQLENGVGMWALFEREFVNSIKPKMKQIDGIIGLVTGEAAKNLIEKLAANIPGQVKVYSVQNNFFGSNVTTSGLLTGKDVIEQVKEKAHQDGCTRLLLPQNMFRTESKFIEYTLDDMHREEIEQKLGIPIQII
ncbi:MAG: DUF512 domain-containing protein [Defluviitaleaceae bacterium]|nr:DUF512 domain-containing protein [Defluviitaleaceae bacterium]